MAIRAAAQHLAIVYHEKPVTVLCDFRQNTSPGLRSTRSRSCGTPLQIVECNATLICRAERVRSDHDINRRRRVTRVNYMERFVMRD